MHYTIRNGGGRASAITSWCLEGTSDPAGDGGWVLIDQREGEVGFYDRAMKAADPRGAHHSSTFPVADAEACANERCDFASEESKS